MRSKHAGNSPSHLQTHVLHVIAQDLGLILTDLESSACTFNWKALADIPRADSSALFFCSRHCTTQARMLLMNCVCSQLVGRNL